MGNEESRSDSNSSSALAGVSKKLDKWIEKLGIHIRVELLQKTALLGTARILRKSLES